MRRTEEIIRDRGQERRMQSRKEGGWNKGTEINRNRNRAKIKDDDVGKREIVS